MITAGGRSHAPSSSTSAVFLLTAGGKNPDVLGASPQARGPRATPAACPPARALARLFPGWPQSRGCRRVRRPSREEAGFLATNSLLASAVLLVRAYAAAHSAPLPCPRLFNRSSAKNSVLTLPRNWTVSASPSGGAKRWSSSTEPETRAATVTWSRNSAKPPWETSNLQTFGTSPTADTIGWPNVEARPAYSPFSPTKIVSSAKPCWSSFRRSRGPPRRPRSEYRGGRGRELAQVFMVAGSTGEPEASTPATPASPRLGGRFTTCGLSVLTRSVPTRGPLPWRRPSSGRAGRVSPRLVPKGHFTGGSPGIATSWDSLMPPPSAGSSSITTGPFATRPTDSMPCRRSLAGS